MTNWQHLGLDYYSFSWYDWLEPYEPLATPPHRPVLTVRSSSANSAGGSAYYAVPNSRPGQLAGLRPAHSAGATGLETTSATGMTSRQPSARGLRNTGATPTSAAPPRHRPGRSTQPYPYAYRDLALQLADGQVVADLRIDVPSGGAYVPHAYLYQVGNPQPWKTCACPAPGHPGMLAAHSPLRPKVRVHPQSRHLRSERSAQKVVQHHRHLCHHRRRTHHPPPRYPHLRSSDAPLPERRGRSSSWSRVRLRLRRRLRLGGDRTSRGDRSRTTAATPVANLRRPNARIR
jgi:hypothetical protein